MSLSQLLPQNFEERCIAFFRKWKILMVGIVAAVVGIILINVLSPSSNQSKKDQLAELLAANQQLNDTIEILKKRSSSGRQKSQNTGSTTFVTIEPGQGFWTPANEKKELYIPKGAVFRARLISSIKTSLQESFVIAETTRAFEMDSKRRIAVGSRLIGSASFDRSVKGVVVEFDTLVTPKGIQYDDLSLIALSENAYPMIEGIYFSDSGIKYGTALAFGFLSGFASGGMEREATPLGSVSKPSLMNQSLSGLSVASFKVADEAMQSLHDQDVEHVVVPAGTDIYLAFTRKWVVPESGAVRK